jgi:cysteine synthase A
MSDWTHSAIRKIEADFNRSSDTHLIRLDLPALRNVTVYLKDESTHPTGSLKHRLARSLFLYGLCNGRIHAGSTIIEASSGSTAVSEAYFARMLGLPFIAVMPRGTSREKVEQITFYGGSCRFVEAREIYTESERLARELGGHYMDQFTYAERATDWRGNNNIADSIFEQMRLEPQPIPAWVVMSAGTGGTTATIGRYIRYRRHATRLCVADPENSVFYDYYNSRDASITIDKASRIEGIGRPRVEPSFLPEIVDKMLMVPDAAALATLYFLEHLLGRKCGGSTGTNLFAAFSVAAELADALGAHSIVTLICDSGERYLDTYYNREWVEKQGLDISPYARMLERFRDTGVWQAER